MAKPAQVRLDADVEDALRAAAQKADASLAKEANRQLRRALGIDVVQRGARAVGASAAAAAPTKAGRCVHPVNRIIGDHCAACGAKV